MHFISTKYHQNKLAIVVTRAYETTLKRFVVYQQICNDHRNSQIEEFAKKTQ